MRTIVLGLFGLSLALSLVVLWVLHNQLRVIYGNILAWKFIFAGVAGLIIKDAMAFYLVATATHIGRGWWLASGIVSLTRVACYLIGFGLWANYRRRLLDRAEEDAT